jgi:hypothetical protein
MRKWQALLILTLWLTASCASLESLPAKTAARPHLPRPTVTIPAGKLKDPVALKEALRDLKLQSDAVYEDYLKR